MKKIVITAGAAVATATIALTAACGGSSYQTAAHKTTASHSAPAAKAPSGPPVLTPGHSVTFKVPSQGEGPDTSVTWTMGSKVVQVTSGSFGSAPSGFEYVAFDLTVRNNGPYPTDGEPTYQASLVWNGTDGRTDDTLAGTAALITPGDYGLSNSSLELQSAVPAGQYASGSVAWQVPDRPGSVQLMAEHASSFSRSSAVQIDYDPSALKTTSASPAASGPGAQACQAYLTAGNAVLAKGKSMTLQDAQDLISTMTDQNQPANSASPALGKAFVKVETDLGDVLNGQQVSNATSSADEQALTNECARYGVTIPSSFSH